MEYDYTLTVLLLARYVSNVAKRSIWHAGVENARNNEKTQGTKMLRNFCDPCFNDRNTKREYLWKTVYKKCYFYVCNNFCKCRPILIIIFYYCIHRWTACTRKAGVKSTTSPQICCRTTLRKLNAQLCNFIARYSMQMWCKIFYMYLPYHVFYRSHCRPILFSCSLCVIHDQNICIVFSDCLNGMSKI